MHGHRKRNSDHRLVKKNLFYEIMTGVLIIGDRYEIAKLIHVIITISKQSLLYCDDQCMINSLTCVTDEKLFMTLRCDIINVQCLADFKICQSSTVRGPKDNTVQAIQWLRDIYKYASPKYSTLRRLLLLPMHLIS